MAKAKTSKAGAPAATTKHKPKAVTAPRRKVAPADPQQTAPPPQPEPTTTAAPDKGAAKVYEPKSRREASLPKDAVLIAKAGSRSEPTPARDLLVVPTSDELLAMQQRGELPSDQEPAKPKGPSPAPEADAEYCYIRMPVRVLVKDARRWAAYHQKRLGTVIELMNPSGKGVLARYDNTDREDRIAEYTPLGFAWHPNWLAPAPKPKPCNGTKPEARQREAGAQADHPRKGNPDLPVAKVLALCRTPEGASPAALLQIGPHCAGRTYLQRLGKTHKLTVSFLPNGNVKFTPKEEQKE